MPTISNSSRPSGDAAASVMSDVEYARMDELECEHWWYVGLRDLIARTLDRYHIAQRPALSVLDAGCGTGENLRMCAARLPHSRLWGFDASQRAIDYARRKVPQAELFVSDVCGPHLPSERFDVVLSCDVLQITGIEAAQQGMTAVAERLKPGGLLLINLPAYQWLYSQHDVAVATRYRFTASQVRRFLNAIGLEPQLVTYRVCALFPLIVLARLPALRRSSSTAAASESTSEPACEATQSQPAPSDLKPVASWMNRGLAAVLRCENQAIAHGGRFPWGSSVFAIARRSQSG